MPQGISADLIATLEGTTRDDVDGSRSRASRRPGARSRRAASRRASCPSSTTTARCCSSKDEYPRPTTTLETLGKLEPSFVAMGAMPVGPNGETFDQLALSALPEREGDRHVHTAGNSSGIVDGAALVLLASESYAKATA